jgi:uncharacterized membrane protein
MNIRDAIVVIVTLVVLSSLWLFFAAKKFLPYAKYAKNIVADFYSYEPRSVQEKPRGP